MFKMMCCEVVVVALVCVKISFGLECPSESISAFRFNLSSGRNATGYRTAKLQLEHVGEENEEMGPWDLEVGHRTKKCGKSESVLVDVTITAPPTEEIRIPRKCPPVPEDYELVDGMGYYKYHRDMKNWSQAVEVCAREGTHILILNSEEEAKTIESMIKKQTNDDYYHWLGIHDLYTEGKFITIFNETAESTGYYKWETDKPQGGTSQNCVGYVLNRGLADWSCTYKQPFICEKSLCETK